MPGPRRSSASTAAFPTPTRPAAASRSRARRGASRCSTAAEIFVASTPGEVRAAFADYELIFSLGIGAIMNVPVRFRGRSLGTMNICAEAGRFTEADRAPGRLLAGLLVPGLLGAS